MTGTLYRNGKIFTADDNCLYADAMIVEDGVVRWAGREADLDRGAAEGLAQTDLCGACVIPGFVDAHMHPVMLADFAAQISALPPKVHSIAELTEEIRRVRAQREKEGRAGENWDGRWIEGWGYDEGKFAEKRSLTRYDLDAGCSDIPVCILRTCGHIRCVNSKALEMAGIDRNTPDPEGGEIERDADGEPTGVLKENARNLVTPFMPAQGEEEKAEHLAALGRLLLSQGITSITDMGNLGKGDNYPLYERAASLGFRQRVGIYYMWDFFADDPAFALPARRRDRRSQFFAAGLKLISDGSVSGRTAWMDQPYLGSGDCGISVCPDQLLESAVAFCKKNRCQLSVHAMGGRAVARIVDRVCREQNWMADDVPYVRVEHITEPGEESIRKAAGSGIAFATQPVFMYAEIESYLANLGEERMRRCYPVRHMLESGVRLCFSTDAPATSWADPSDPFTNLKAAVTRKAWDGTDCGQQEAVDIETAVKLYTRESARIAGFPDTGRLKEGYRADFAVLDRDLFTILPEEIDRVKVKRVYMDGQEVYGRSGNEI